jgi:GT2 family glycosyltransferase
MPQVSVVIATKNRLESLRAALRSVALQGGVEFETIVMDDGSTDGTPAAVAAEFPAVRVDRSPQSLGYIVQRNRGVALAGSEVVVMIDDDTTLPDPATLVQTVADFDSPRVGAVAMPYINLLTDPGVLCKAAPDRLGVFVTPSFIGCAHAVRRTLFQRLGGYCEALQHYWEESDFCLRLLDAGYVTRLGRAPAAHHHQTPATRINHRQRYFAARNTILTGWKSVPRWYLPPHLAGVTAREFRLMLRFGLPLATLRGIAAGYRDGISLRLGHPANVVSPSTYRLLWRLKRNSATPLSEIEPLLPKLSDLPAVDAPAAR